MSNLPVPQASNVPSDDLMRAQILSLYGKCDHDVSLLMERVVRALQDTGRTDLRYESDANGAVMTIAQSMHHAPAKHRGDFITVLDALTDPTRVGVVSPEEIMHKAMREAAELTRARTLEASISQLSSNSTYDFTPHNDAHRCFAFTAEDQRLAELPTSKYSGNFLLRRWGGSLPKHQRYDHYSKFGCSGRGAASAEFHNFPNGRKPYDKSA
jgi:hypothetical protein